MIWNIFLLFLHYAGNAIQAFGNGTDVGVWQPQPPIVSTPPDPYTPQRGRDRTSNTLDDPALTNDLNSNADHLYSFCRSLQVLKASSMLYLQKWPEIYILISESHLFI